MRFKPVLHALGLMLICEAVLMVPALLVSVIYGDGDTLSFVYTIGLLLAAGLPAAVCIRSKVKSLYTREGFALVGLGWILLSLFGMLPFLFSGTISSPIDAFFEAVSGFTTTGSSILKAVEGLPHGILFWRSLTHWAGGMGVLMLTIALLPQIGLQNMEILRAESPGPNPSKILPRIRETAKVLYFIYFGLSLVLLVSLLFTGMPVFDSLVNTFGAAGTGGFSVLNVSIGGYHNPAAEIILGIFMLLFGVNFSVYFVIIMKKFKKALCDREMLMYFGIVGASVLLILVDIMPRLGNIWEALRQSFFQVSSIVTTTGYATTDFNQWPMFSQCIIMFLMFMGACAGSTGGGLKVIRLMIVGKVARRELKYLLHPRIVRTVSVDGKAVPETMIRSVLSFMSVYVLILIVATMIVSLDGFNFISSFTAVLSALGNIGPGLGMVGPMGNFSDFSELSTVVLSICMLLGRLEILPILLLFSPSLWKKM